jgi:hypothetical protein
MQMHLLSSPEEMEIQSFDPENCTGFMIQHNSLVMAEVKIHTTLLGGLCLPQQQLGVQLS